MASRLIKLDQKKKTITINGLVLEQRLVFEFFDKQKETERDQLLVKAFLLGVLALSEDRFAAFLSKTTNTLGTELETLKYILDLNKELFFRTTGKGREAEYDIADQLSQYARAKEYRDIVEHCGDSFGALPKNKTGDVAIKVNGDESSVIAIESKFDKAKRLGLIESKDIFSKGDTAVSQLLEASLNRRAQHSIIVFDESAVDAKLKEQVGAAKYIPHVGFVCIIDLERGDFESLFICYELARNLILGAVPNAAEYGVLSLIIGRFLHDLNIYSELKSLLLRSLADHREMIELIDKAHLSLEFTKSIFSEFCKNGHLTKEQILELYAAESVKDKYSRIKEDLKL